MQEFHLFEHEFCWRTHVTKDESDFASRLDWALTNGGIPRGRGRVGRISIVFAVTRETARQWTLGRMPAIAMLRALCERLGTSLDWLAMARGRPEIQPQLNEPLSAYSAELNERELLERFRRLSPQGQRALLTLLSEE